MVGVKLDLEAWAEKFKVLASNRTDRDQLGSRRVWWGQGWGWGQGSAYQGHDWGALLGTAAHVPSGLQLRPHHPIHGTSFQPSRGTSSPEQGRTVPLTLPPFWLTV